MTAGAKSRVPARTRAGCTVPAAISTERHSCATWRAPALLSCMQMSKGDTRLVGPWGGEITKGISREKQRCVGRKKLSTLEKESVQKAKQVVFEDRRGQ